MICIQFRDFCVLRLRVVTAVYAVGIHINLPSVAARVVSVQGHVIVTSHEASSSDDYLVTLHGYKHVSTTKPAVAPKLSILRINVALDGSYIS